MEFMKHSNETVPYAFMKLLVTLNPFLREAL